MAVPQPQIRFTLKQLQYFAATARTGQVSLAAAESNVSQSAMTSAIAELERTLDTLLFERSRHGVTLTHEGHLFLQHAQAVLEAAGDAARHPFRERSDVAGRQSALSRLRVAELLEARRAAPREAREEAGGGHGPEHAVLGLHASDE